MFDVDGTLTETSEVDEAGLYELYARHLTSAPLTRTGRRMLGAQIPVFWRPYSKSGCDDHPRETRSGVFQDRFLSLLNAAADLHTGLSLLQSLT
jgi:hypothetical protein